MTQTATYPDLDGASVFITGGGSGIGAFLTEGFLRQGARVAFVGRSDATEFCDRMERDTGSRPLFIQCDITDIPALKAAIDEAAEAHGPITALVNNAANDQRHTTLEVTEDFWDWSQAINLKAYFFACQAVIPGMQDAGGGTTRRWRNRRDERAGGGGAGETPGGARGIPPSTRRDRGGRRRPSRLRRKTSTTRGFANKSWSK